jgi:biotin carboxyl carrier protein
MRRRFLLLHGAAQPEELALEGSGPDFRITWANRVQRLEAVRLHDGRISLLLENGRQFCGRLTRREAGFVEVTGRGQSRRIELTEPLSGRLAHAAHHLDPSGDEEIRALIPGRVLEVSVKTGDRVESGALLLVLEAMKMQNEIRTARGGVIGPCNVSPGLAVEGGALLLTVRVSSPDAV